MSTHDLELSLTDLFEGRLEGEDLADLQRELHTNPEARLAYRDYARLQNVLQLRAEGSDPMYVISMDQVVERRRRRYLKSAALASAAVLVLALIAMGLILIRTPEPTLAFVASPGSEFSLSHELAGEEAPTGLVLEPGSRLEIRSGTVELHFGSGVRGIVRGPADLTLRRDDLLDLARGTAWFHVPGKASGFQVSTPDLILTDLGTEFGILSQAEFLDEVHVFSGEVEITNRYGLKRRETVTVGQARVAGPAGRWNETPLREDHFLTGLPVSEPREFEETVVHDDFESDSSADYLCLDYYRGGEFPERFRIDDDDNGLLEITPGRGRAGQVVHRSATLEVGQTFRMDWLTPAQSGYGISQVLTDRIDQKRYSVRLRVSDGAYQIDFRGDHEAGGTMGSVEWHNRSPYTAPETFWVKRMSPTQFAWYRGAEPTERIKIAEITLDSAPGPLHVGVQAWATTARFDNLAILRSEDLEEPADDRVPESR